VTSLADGARAVLDANWRAGVADGVRFGYARPDAAKYPAQFLWDSCFHCFAWSHLEPARGREELRSLVRAQEPDGFIGHTIFWDAPIRRSRRAFYNVLEPGDRMTRSIQPPFVALAWEAVAARSHDDPGFAAEGLAPLRAYHDWLARERDLDASGLLAIVQPDECGLDASPKFDRIVGWRAAGFPGFVALVRENRRRAFSLRRSLAEGGFAVQEVLVNVAYALSLQALARLGDAASARQAERVRDALLERCLDARGGLFFDRARGEPLAVSTFTSLAPLALPDLPREVATRLVEEHVLDRRRYWLPYPIPSVAADESSFRPRTRVLLRYWRGPTWLPCAWIVHRGLLAHGFGDVARTLAARVVELVRRSGFREYYDPLRGVPMGARCFGMSTLAVDMAAAHPGLAD
jgi:Mannosylglycerate hydrolase MGH1-like glycoside hydrolase domain